MQICWMLMWFVADRVVQWPLVAVRELIREIRRYYNTSIVLKHTHKTRNIWNKSENQATESFLTLLTLLRIYFCNVRIGQKYISQVAWVSFCSGWPIQVLYWIFIQRSSVSHVNKRLSRYFHTVSWLLYLNTLLLVSFLPYECGNSCSRWAKSKETPLHQSCLMKKIVSTLKILIFHLWFDEMVQGLCDTP